MPLAISIEAMRLEVLRELGLRSRVYPRWITKGTLRAETAAMQTERMQAVLEALEELRLARAFFELAVVAGIERRAITEGKLVLSCPGTAGQLLEALQSWAAPREAPLTTGSHAKGPE